MPGLPVTEMGICGCSVPPCWSHADPSHVHVSLDSAIPGGLEMTAPPKMTSWPRTLSYAMATAPADAGGCTAAVVVVHVPVYVETDPSARL